MGKRDNLHVTPPHLYEAAMRICEEPDREYPYIAVFHLMSDGRHQLFDLLTISHRDSNHHDGGYLSVTGWDVDWIERYGLYCYQRSSGGGGLRQEIDGVYWQHPELEGVVRERTARYSDREFRKRNKTRRLRPLPKEYAGYEDLMVFLEETGLQSSVYYCTVCEEYLPEGPDYECKHVWWCDSSAFLRGPGSTEETEPCTDEECWECNRAKEARRG